jgi:hypothetical protein
MLHGSPLSLSDDMDCWRNPSLLGHTQQGTVGGKTRMCFWNNYSLQLKPAKSLVSHTPRRLGAARCSACTPATVLCTRRTCRTGEPARHHTPAIVVAVCEENALTSHRQMCLTIKITSIGEQVPT